MRAARPRLRSPWGAVKAQVDPRIDVHILHPGVEGHVGVPVGGVVADKVVGLAGEWLEPGDPGRGIGAGESHAQDGAVLGLLGGVPRARFSLPLFFRRSEDEHRLCGGQEERVAPGAGEEFDLGIGLPSVGLEVEGEGAVGGARLPGRGCGLGEEGGRGQVDPRRRPSTRDSRRASLGEGEACLRGEDDPPDGDDDGQHKP